MKPSKQKLSPVSKIGPPARSACFVTKNSRNKIIIAWLFFTLVSFSCRGQEESHEPFFSAGITCEYIDISGLKSVVAPGIAGELRLNKLIGARYSFAATQDYYHLGSGLLFYPLFLLGDKTDSPYTVVFLLLTLFEHTNFHIKLTEGIEWVPYLSLLRIRYLWDENSLYNDSVFASGSIGSSLNFKIGKNWSTALSWDGTQLYRPGRPKGWEAGIALIYEFRQK